MTTPQELAKSDLPRVTATPDKDYLLQRYQRESGTVHLTGMQALVRLLLDQRRSDARAGVTTGGLVSGYPGSPVGGLDLELERQKAYLKTYNIIHVPGLNEELAATAVFGTQILESVPHPKVSGAFGMWFGKAPGVDRSGDAFRHYNYRGMSRHGGVIAVAGDDPAPRSTIVPSDSTVAFYDWHMPVLVPGGVQDILTLGLHGYALSRSSGLAIGLRLVNDVAEGSGTVEVGPTLVQPVIPEVEFEGHPFRPTVRPEARGSRMVEVEREILEARLVVASRYGQENGINRVTHVSSNDRFGIVATGNLFPFLLRTLEDLGLGEHDLARLGIRLLRLGMPFPLDKSQVRSFARGLQEVLVIEEKRPFVELLVKDALYGLTAAPQVLGKRDNEDKILVPGFGQLTEEAVSRVLGRRLAVFGALPRRGEEHLARLDSKRRLGPIEVARTPFFCSGCPHNRSLVTPSDAVVGLGIGCHIMASFAQREDFGRITGFTHMGAEGAQWLGVAPFTDTKHFFQNIGDGTFAHSGSLALRFAVASGANITYKLLYNSAVGMTGGQAVTGGQDVAGLLRLLEAEGVKKIIVTTDDPHKFRHQRLPKIASVSHRDRLLEAQEELAQIPGVTVLVHDQQCAAEKRRLRKRKLLPEPDYRVMINERVCEACGDCAHKSNCLSLRRVDTAFGAKTQIDQSSCNLDYSCILGDCPAFTLVKPGTTESTTGGAVRYEPPDDLPTPVLTVPTDRWGAYMTGIGGTGVVTVSQVIATAAALGGYRARTVDVTGSSQKAGAVTSELHLERSDLEEVSNLGSVDLYLACDVLTASQPEHLRRIDGDRTVAVVSTSPVPTGRMSADPSLPFPAVDALVERIDALARGGQSLRLDAEALATHLVGDNIFANVLLLGAALQAGAVPLRAEDIEAALRVNGVATEANIAAFRWGRTAVALPDVVSRQVKRYHDGTGQALRDAIQRLEEFTGLPEPLASTVCHRAADLAGYQDLRYARQYIGFVRGVLQEEERRTGRTVIAEAVAINLYKLMAYKDEYEVARLHLLPESRRQVEERFGTSAEVVWLLHPPLLRSLGLKRKIRLGRWFTPALIVLRAARRVRGTPFDVFGYTKMRRAERAAPEQYRAMITACISHLDDESEGVVRSLAELPDQVRGYESIKLDSMAAYAEKAGALMTELGVEFPRTVVQRPADPRRSEGESGPENKERNGASR